MAANEPAIDNWDAAPWEASAGAEWRQTPLTAVAAAEEPAGALRAAAWPLAAVAGLTVWAGALYGFLRLLTDPFG